MSTDFNWQTEEESWEQEHQPQEQNRRPIRRWLPTALVLVIILGVIGFLMYRQVQRQIEAAVARTETDIQRTHELVLEAANRRDKDLLNNLISSRNIDWTEQQLQLAEAGYLFNPKPFGLVAQADAETHYEFELSADLTEAELITSRPFTVQSLAGISETIILKQHAIYRHGQDRWLFAPPVDLEAYWGPETTEDGRFLTITYPERDADQAHYLFQYLDTKLAQMCTDLVDFNCPDDLEIHLTLDTNSDKLLDLHEVSTQYENGPEITLPTISLIGIPEGEDGEEALYRSYAAFVLPKAMVIALDWECCLRGLFFRALVDYQLAELGVRAYPMHPDDYEKLFARFQNIDQLDDYWRQRQVELVEFEDWQWPYAVVDFILSTTFADTTPGAMQQSLLTEDFYTNWLEDFLLQDVHDLSIQRAWLNFIYSRSLSGQVALGTYTPAQDILLACDNISSPRTRLYRYDWNIQDWVADAQFQEATFYMASVPDDSAVIVQQQDFVSSGSTFMWQDGRRTTLFNGAADEQGVYYFFGKMAPDGRKLIMARAVGIGDYSLLDVDQCTDVGCIIRPLPGIPEWSPDGTQTLIQFLKPEGDIMHLTGLGRINDNNEVIELSDTGILPFWIGNDEYGYLSFEERGAIYTASTEDDQPHEALTVSDLLESVQTDDAPKSLILQDVVTNPANQNILAISAAYVEGAFPTQNYIFFWNRVSGEINFIDVLDQVGVGSIEWIPGGEWLMAATYDIHPSGPGNSNPWSYYLYNVSGEESPVMLSRDESIEYPLLDRSLDGHWLALPRAGYVELIDLKERLNGNRPYRTLLPHNFNNCREALFIW